MARCRKGKEIDCIRESKKMKTDGNEDVNPQLWYAFAGGIVKIPKVNSNIFYFPQGHAEHAYEPVHFPADIKIPSHILCRVAAIHYRADLETDEVYVKIRLVPLVNFDDDPVVGIDHVSATTKTYQFYIKKLTVSDTKHGSSSFSCHKNCSGTIFPQLDCLDIPTSQEISSKDVHGKKWEFKHVCSHRQHQLRTGWSEFLTQKQLAFGDSLVFVKPENGPLHIGIRRSKGATEFGFNPSSKSKPSNEIGTSLVPSFGELTSSISNKVMRIGNVKAEDVIEAVKLGVNMQPFDVVYYPRVGSPEFFVETSLVRKTLEIPWYNGMRFKMAIETEDSSMINWFTGTIASIQAADPAWPDSIWRILQVTWDNPDLVTETVNPWQVEILPDMQGAMHDHFFSHLRNILFNNYAIKASTTVLNNPALQNKSTSGTDLCSIPEKRDCVKPKQIVLFGQTIEVDSGNENAEKKTTSSSSDPLQDLPKRSSGESECRKDTLAEETMELED